MASSPKNEHEVGAGSGLQSWARPPSPPEWSPSFLASMEVRSRRLRKPQRRANKVSAPVAKTKACLPESHADFLAWLTRSDVENSPMPKDQSLGSQWWMWAIEEVGNHPVPEVHLSTKTTVVPKVVAKKEEPKTVGSTLGLDLPTRVLEAAVLRGWSEKGDASTEALFGPELLKQIKPLLYMGATQSTRHLVASLGYFSTEDANIQPNITPPREEWHWEETIIQASSPAFELSRPPDSLPCLACLLGTSTLLHLKSDFPIDLTGNPLAEGPLPDTDDLPHFSMPKRQPALGRFLMRLRDVGVERVLAASQGGGTVCLTIMDREPEIGLPPLVPSLEDESFDSEFDGILPALQWQHLADLGDGEPVEMEMIQTRSLFSEFLAMAEKKGVWSADFRHEMTLSKTLFSLNTGLNEPIISPIFSLKHLKKTVEADLEKRSIVTLGDT